MPRLDLRASFYGGPGFTLYHAWGSNSALSLSPHFHDEYLICAQISGEEKCQVGGKPHHFSVGDIVLINPQQVHSGNLEGSEALEYLSLYVDRGVVERLAQELEAPTRNPEFTVVKISGNTQVFERLMGLLELARRLDGERAEPGLGAVAGETGTEAEGSLAGVEIEVEAGVEVEVGVEVGSAGETGAEVGGLELALRELLILVFGEFSNLDQPMLRSTNRVSHRKIARSVEYIRSLELAEGPPNVSLDHLAEVAGLSKYHFLRQFSQVVGMTPGAYLRTLRLCHAARKLRTTPMPILEIALSVGFADHPSFSRAFARHMGMTPSEYQKLGPL